MTRIFFFISILLIGILIPRVRAGHHNDPQLTEIEEISRKLFDNYNIPNMVVGITSKDSVLFLKSFGDGTEDDIYLIGSVCKTFTDTVSLMMAEEGLI